MTIHLPFYFSNVVPLAARTHQESDEMPQANSSDKLCVIKLFHLSSRRQKCISQGTHNKFKTQCCYGWPYGTWIDPLCFFSFTKSGPVLPGNKVKKRSLEFARVKSANIRTPHSSWCFSYIAFHDLHRIHWIIIMVIYCNINLSIIILK